MPCNQSQQKYYDTKGRDRRKQSVFCSLCNKIRTIVIAPKEYSQLLEQDGQKIKRCRACFQNEKETICFKCGINIKTSFYTRRKTQCKECLKKDAISRKRLRKALWVDYKGGKCQICGYDRYQGALEFHHRDPTQKHPKWTIMCMWKFDERVKNELDKCDLLCRNCHAEIEHSFIASNTKTKMKAGSTEPAYFLRFINVTYI